MACFRQRRAGTSLNERQVKPPGRRLDGFEGGLTSSPSSTAMDTPDGRRLAASQACCTLPAKPLMCLCRSLAAVPGRSLPALPGHLRRKPRAARAGGGIGSDSRLRRTEAGLRRATIACCTRPR